MSFLSINTCVNDQEFVGRLNACAAQEGAFDPVTKAFTLRWAVAATNDIASAYDSALAAGNPSPGGDPAVITDLMILSAVQAHWDDVP